MVSQSESQKMSKGNLMVIAFVLGWVVMGVFCLLVHERELDEIRKEATKEVPPASILPEAQQCVAFAEGEPVPPALAYSGDGWWGFEGRDLAYAEHEDSDFVICAEVSTIQAILNG